MFKVPHLNNPMLSCYDLSVDVEWPSSLLGFGDVILPGKYRIIAEWCSTYQQTNIFDKLNWGQFFCTRILKKITDIKPEKCIWLRLTNCINNYCININKFTKSQKNYPQTLMLYPYKFKTRPMKKTLKLLVWFARNPLNPA